MNKLIALQSLTKKIGCKIRLKPYREGVPTNWQDGFGLPAPGYIELTGPERIVDIDWIELDPIVLIYVGRLIPPKVAVVTDDIIQVLTEETISYQVVKRMIRVDGSELR